MVHTCKKSRETTGELGGMSSEVNNMAQTIPGRLPLIYGTCKLKRSLTGTDDPDF